MMHRGRRRNRRGGRVRPPVADSLNITAPPTQAAQFSPGSTG